MVYGRDMFCQHGHHKRDAHLCEWGRASEFFAKFKPHAAPQNRVLGSQPQDKKAEEFAKANENLRKENERLRQGRGNDDAIFIEEVLGVEKDDESMEPKENEATLKSRLE